MCKVCGFEQATGDGVCDYCRRYTAKGPKLRPYQQECVDNVMRELIDGAQHASR